MRHIKFKFLYLNTPLSLSWPKCDGVAGVFSGVELLFFIDYLKNVIVYISRAIVNI